MTNQQDGADRDKQVVCVKLGRRSKVGDLQLILKRCAPGFNMSIKSIKIVSSVSFALSLIWAFFNFLSVISILKIIGGVDIGLIAGNIIFLFLILSHIAAALITVASVGLYKLKRWGHILANISIIVFNLHFICTTF